MKIGIIGAMEEEIKLLKEKLQERTSWTRAGISFYKGNIGKHEIVLVQSGIGKVQAALTTSLLIQEFGVNAIVNTGSAGGVGSGLSVGDLVIGDKNAYFDVDVTGFGYAYGQLPAQPLYFEASKYLLMSMEEAAEKSSLHTNRGLIVTGDSFVHAPSKVLEIKEHFPDVLAVEMEGAAIAQVAHQFGIPFLVIRAMSDTADHKATQSFDEFIVEAGKRSGEMVLKFLEIVK
ncbi:adenosylhomocysteine nucleosidase [Pilibacter termitis]|uniref:5'-methylthioadenosine/S-adenosylhomocysteine nucleosidase n=1 Tax=Pilibacter termitis TaxID=263852 RepID=A0A1T4Q6R0_9ENTE|nr:5'-methylthioadenosine/adenosylhomocysteine nucleosidase [Pilibacter termitis]SJZ99374.1 adenosylhomocysteine nucleosidase [Pilibacter termitis]